MKSLRRAVQAARNGVSTRAIGLLAAAIVTTVLPTQAMASEGELIPIKFDSSLQVSLVISLAIGIIALLYGLVFLRKFVTAQSPGNDKMQEVGLAIREGALAYLTKQIRTMSIFIALLFCGLVGLYWRMGLPMAFGIGGCFVAGVIASYLSGYAGMLMAVSGNMRTANAALTSYRLSLVTAFRSGAVAGTVTVGIGLIGATLILLIFPAYAHFLLIGFGFGASLAALFMRVGGGIFTKAADVGADLVGKIEAGIPEDDPRNPAVIADNVGDNVGDCAGMAADVFESYEVMLVAAIVLGAASSVMFDANTWPRLIVFGLTASAVGLLASMIGIHSVKGSDNINDDPLQALKKGFNKSALIAVVGVGILAFFTMGGRGTPIQTSTLKSATEYQKDEIAAVQAVAKRLAAEKHVETYQITGADLLADADIKKLGFIAPDDTQLVTSESQADLSQALTPQDLKGLSPVTDFNDASNKTLNFATIKPPKQGEAPNQAEPFQSLGAAYGSQAVGDQVKVYQLHYLLDIPPQPAQGAAPARTAQHIDRTQWVGPMPQSQFDGLYKDLQQKILTQHIKGSAEALLSLPVSLYTAPDGRVALVLPDAVTRPQLIDTRSLTYYQLPATAANDATKTASQASPPSLPPAKPIPVAVLNHVTVPWYAFWLTLAFGIGLAFLIEFITDYYVSTHKAPTQEVAGVATAGAAPMVIQGFAHAATSSVFMVLGIVVALLFPLFFFNPAVYGGYTLSFYGIALVGIGLLTATAYVLAMDTFGPISDNAQGVFEMSGASQGNEQAAKIVARLDAAGNTTKALTKGFAISTAVVAAVALFHSYLEGAHLGGIGLRLDMPEIFLGLLIGGAAPYLFSAFSINAVGRASFELINEVRRQFKEDAGIMKGSSKPDYARCVAIVTAAAQKELLAPGILAIALPAAVGFGFSIGKATTEINGQAYNLVGAEALGGFLAGAIVSGQLMAVLLANSGGMWDNAKKLIEDGLHGGKGTEAHKASIVCDTIGDPFKDTAGPALNPLIKVMNLVALLLSGVIIMPLGTPVLVGVTAVCVAALAVAVILAKKGSMSEAMALASKEAGAADSHFGLGSDGNAPVIATAATVATEGPKKKKLFVEEEAPEEPKVP